MRLAGSGAAHYNHIGVIGKKPPFMEISDLHLIDGAYVKFKS